MYAGDEMYGDEITSGIEPGDDFPDARCPACGDPIDYCQGHGEIGDPAGFALLAEHDSGVHLGCHPDGCDDAGKDTRPAIERYGTPEHEAWLIEMERVEG